MNKRILALAMVFSFVASAANANFRALKPYAGVDIGWAKADIDDLEKKTGLSGLEDDWVVFSANAGIRFNKYIGAETSVLVSGDNETEYGPGDVRLRYNSIGIDAVGYIPLFDDKFEIFGQAGVAYHYMEMEIRRHRTWGWNQNWKKRTTTKDDDKIAPRVALGFQYNMNKNFSFRVMGRYTFLDHKYVDSLTEVITGVRYNF